MNQKKNYRDSLTGYGLSAVLGIAATLGWASCAQAARCGSCSTRSFAVSSYQAPVIAAAIPVYATVSPGLQQEAVATHGFRGSPEYLEYQRLIGYRERAEQELAAYSGGALVEEVPAEEQPYNEPIPYQSEAEAQAAKQAWQAEEARKAQWAQAQSAKQLQSTVRTVDTIQGLVECPPAAQQTCPPTATANPPAQAPTAAVAWLQKAAPNVAATCVRCHKSDEDQGGFNIAAVLQGAKKAQDYGTINAIARTVSNGHMPPKAQLPWEQRNKVVDQILALGDIPQPQPEQVPPSQPAAPEPTYN